MSVRNGWLLNIVLMFFHGVFLWMSYGSLPRRIPIHFNLAGQPDRFARTSILLWVTPLLIVMGFSFFFYLMSLGVRWVGRQNPGALTIPLKPIFLKLPRERQEILVGMMEGHLALQAILISCLFIFLQMAVLGVILKSWSFHLLFLPAFTLWCVLITVLTLSLYARMKSVIERFSRETI
ncbi:MAG TPA: DUF1648 domain-containing protein [Thermoanaerobaculia bacterium]|nr:DUF1648 domain-containing protein [Thermoanaerobaculia bacterium]HUM30274.1 DUF1648 domain-containing protein [Thermoanaerobaculia bacterium]HXK68430.1 DUF1648 domain-containing protein [Thermoanaerobaculia bacterium]